MKKRPEKAPSHTPGQWISLDWLPRFNTQQTTAHRVYTSRSCWIERFGADFLISYKEEPDRDRLVPELLQWNRTAGLKTRRIFAKLLARTSPERDKPLLVHGDSNLSPQTTTLENGMTFGLDFSAGYSSGLFIDQRANRAELRARPAKKLLNTFAYTCSFSVTAALDNAETVSVDLSKKSLDRGKENFTLNALDPAKHRFIADDVFSVLPYLQRKGETFDAMVLDPPTFSRADKGRVFQVERDFEKLLLLALELAAPSARILLSVNCHKMDARDLENTARYAVKAARKQGTLRPGASLPDFPDYAVPITLWLDTRG